MLYVGQLGGGLATFIIAGNPGDRAYALRCTRIYRCCTHKDWGQKELESGEYLRTIKV